MRATLPVLILGLSSAVSAQEIPFKDRTPVPAFELQQVDGPPLAGTRTGGSVSSRDLYGHLTVLELFYPGCGPCTTTHSRMQHLATAFSDSAVRVLSISADTNTIKIKEWLRAQGGTVLPTLVLSKELELALTLRAVPRIIVVDIGGNIALDRVGATIPYDSLPAILSRLRCENASLRC